MADIKKIRAAYISGKLTNREISSIYGISERQLYRHITEGNWKEARQKRDMLEAEKSARNSARERASQKERSERIAEKILSAIEARIDSGECSVDDLDRSMRSVQRYRDMMGIVSGATEEKMQAEIEKLRHDCRDEERTEEIRVVLPEELEGLI